MHVNIISILKKVNKMMKYPGDCKCAQIDPGREVQLGWICRSCGQLVRRTYVDYMIDQLKELQLRNMIRDVKTAIKGELK